jgi:pSer/pThr/pTyr-binding forkhead associated (FHA) protein
MAASLVPMEGGSPIALDKPIMLIGRNQDCDISLQVSSKISRRHCCIVQCGDRYVLRDLGSMNGVRVNSTRVVEANLQAGDEVAVADIAFTFRTDEARTKENDRPLRRPLPEKTPTPPPDAEVSDEYPEPLAEEHEHENPSRTYSDDQILENEVRLNDDSESEAGFVHV